MPPLKRKKAFAWITVSAVALTGTGAFAQLGIRETSIVFSLFVRFALAALILLVMAPLERLRSLRTIPTVQGLPRRLRDVLAVCPVRLPRPRHLAERHAALQYRTAVHPASRLDALADDDPGDGDREYRPRLRRVSARSWPDGERARRHAPGRARVGVLQLVLAALALCEWQGRRGAQRDRQPVPVLHALRRSLPRRAAVPSGRPDDRGASAGRERDPRLVRRAQRVRRGEPVRTQRCLPERP